MRQQLIKIETLFLAHPKQNERGFTLLEIIVVTVIIGLVAAMIGLSFHRNIDKVAHEEALRFRALLEQLREESIISARTLGIEIDETDSSYQFIETGQDSKWTTLVGDDLFRRREIPDYLSMNLELETNEPGLENIDPIIVSDAMGEISRFSFNINAEQMIYQVTLDDGQNLKVKSIDKSRIK